MIAAKVQVRRAGVADAADVARLVDVLLAELSGGPSRYEARLETAKRVLPLNGRAFGFLALDQQKSDGGDDARGERRHLRRRHVRCHY